MKKIGIIFLLFMLFANQDGFAMKRKREVYSDDHFKNKKIKDSRGSCLDIIFKNLEETQIPGDKKIQLKRHLSEFLDIQDEYKSGKYLKNFVEERELENLITSDKNSSEFKEALKLFFKLFIYMYDFGRIVDDNLNQLSIEYFSSFFMYVNILDTKQFFRTIELDDFFSANIPYAGLDDKVSINDENRLFKNFVFGKNDEKKKKVLEMISKRFWFIEESLEFVPFEKEEQKEDVLRLVNDRFLITKHLLNNILEIRKLSVNPSPAMFVAWSFGLSNLMRESYKLMFGILTDENKAFEHLFVSTFIGEFSAEAGDILIKREKAINRKLNDIFFKTESFLKD